jgi:hypothetical protein
MSKFLTHLFAAFAAMDGGIIRERVQAAARRTGPGESAWVGSAILCVRRVQARRHRASAREDGERGDHIGAARR